MEKSYKETLEDLKVATEEAKKAIVNVFSEVPEMEKELAEFSKVFEKISDERFMMGKDRVIESLDDFGFFKTEEIPLEPEDISFNVAEISVSNSVKFTVKNPTNEIESEMFLSPGDTLTLHFTPDDEFLQKLWNKFGWRE